jgi:hypothetical protein
LVGLCSEGQGGTYGCACGEKRASVHHTNV